MLRLFAAVLALFAAATASAQGYPSRPVKIVVPYTAGGSSDFTARMLAEKLGPLLGSQVVVENKPGGNTLIANNAIISPLVLSVHPSVPAKNVAELVAYAKANPGKVNFGSAGVGNTLHLATELFKMKIGVVSSIACMRRSGRP